MASSGEEILGEGTSGSCCKVVHPRTKEELVIKTFKEDTLDGLLSEVDNLHKLQGPGVQKVVGVCLTSRQLITDFAG